MIAQLSFSILMLSFQSLAQSSLNLTANSSRLCTQAMFLCSAVDLPSTSLRWSFNDNDFAHYTIVANDIYPLTLEPVNATFNDLLGGVSIQILEASANEDNANFLSTMTANVATLYKAGILVIKCGSNAKKANMFLFQTVPEAPSSVSMQLEYDENFQLSFIHVQWHQVTTMEEYCSYYVNYTVLLTNSVNMLFEVQVGPENCKSGICFMNTSISLEDDCFSVNIIATNIFGSSNATIIRSVSTNALYTSWNITLAALALLLYGTVFALFVVFAICCRAIKARFIASLILGIILLMVVAALWIASFTYVSQQKDTCTSQWRETRNLLIITSFCVSIIAILLHIVSILIICISHKTRTITPIMETKELKPIYRDKTKKKGLRQYADSTTCQVCKVTQFSLLHPENIEHYCGACAKDDVCTMCISNKVEYQDGTKRVICDLCYNHCPHNMGYILFKDGKQKYFEKKFLIILFNPFCLRIYPAGCYRQAWNGKVSLATSPREINLDTTKKVETNFSLSSNQHKDITCIKIDTKLKNGAAPDSTTYFIIPLGGEFLCDLANTLTKLNSPTSVFEHYRYNLVLADILEIKLEENWVKHFLILTAKVLIISEVDDLESILETHTDTKKLFLSDIDADIVQSSKSEMKLLQHLFELE